MKRFRRHEETFDAVQWEHTDQSLQEMKEFPGRSPNTVKMRIERNIVVIRQGDWVVRDRNGSIYTVAPELFEKEYEAIDG